MAGFLAGQPGTVGGWCGFPAQRIGRIRQFRLAAADVRPVPDVSGSVSAISGKCAAGTEWASADPTQPDPGGRDGLAGRRPGIAEGHQRDLCDLAGLPGFSHRLAQSGTLAPAAGRMHGRRSRQRVLDGQRAHVHARQRRLACLSAGNAAAVRCCCGPPRQPHLRHVMDGRSHNLRHGGDVLLRQRYCCVPRTDSAGLDQPCFDAGPGDPGGRFAVGPDPLSGHPARGQRGPQRAFTATARVDAPGRTLACLTAGPGLDGLCRSSVSWLDGQRTQQTRASGLVAQLRALGPAATAHRRIGCWCNPDGRLGLADSRGGCTATPATTTRPVVAGDDGSRNGAVWWRLRSADRPHTA